MCYFLLQARAARKETRRTGANNNPSGRQLFVSPPTAAAGGLVALVSAPAAGGCDKVHLLRPSDSAVLSAWFQYQASCNQKNLAIPGIGLQQTMSKVLSRLDSVYPAADDHMLISQALTEGNKAQNNAKHSTWKRGRRTGQPVG